MKRGMTLLEVLLAVGLLAGVAAGAASWLSSAAAAASRGPPEAKWRAAAVETLRLIADDLASGDPPLSSSRAETHAGRLCVLTRLPRTGEDTPGGPALVVYRFDGETLRRDEHEWRGSLVPGSPAQRSRVLLGRTGAFSAALDGQFRWLTVTIQSDRGVALTRRCAVP